MKPEMRSLFLLIFFILPLVSGAQKNGETVITVGDEKISKKEFRTVYLKNNDDSTITKEDLEEYLDLFIDFKLKVKEAERMGFDTTESFRKEFERYREQLAQPYFKDSSTQERLLREAYQRTKQEVHASHILVSLDEDAPPEDTAKVYEKALKIKEEVGSENFIERGKEIAKEDPKVQASDLGYFNAFRMVYPFENLAYNAEVGSVGGPVRTRFGYHLIKVHDKRPSKGKIRVAHIMKRAPEKASPEEKKKAEERIREIRKKIVEEGMDFHRAARQHSEDQRSSRRGGRLSWFQSGEMVPAFSKAAFALDSNGALSEPVRTRFGWHLIKRLDHKGVESFEAMRSELEQDLKESDRYELVKKTVLKRLRDEYDLTINERNLKRMARSLPDSDFDPQRWEKAQSGFAQKTLFSFADTSFPLASLAERIGETKELPEGKKAKRAFLKAELSPLIDEELEAFERDGLKEKHPRYRALLKEYRDGILLFELMEEKVWQKALEDTVGLKGFYEANKENYRWDQRLDLTYFRCNERSTAEEIHRMLGDGKSGKAVRMRVKESKELSARVDSGAFEKPDRPFLDKIQWKEGVSKVVPAEDRFYVAKVHGVLEPSVKELDEARGIVSSDYQDHLERKWVEELRGKYPIEVNEELLYSIAEDGQKGR